MDTWFIFGNWRVTSSSHELEIFKGKKSYLLVPLTLRDLLRTPVLAEGIELTPAEDELVEMFHSLRSYSQTVVFEKVVTFLRLPEVVHPSHIS